MYFGDGLLRRFALRSPARFLLHAGADPRPRNDTGWQTGGRQMMMIT